MFLRTVRISLVDVAGLVMCWVKWRTTDFAIRPPVLRLAGSGEKGLDSNSANPAIWVAAATSSAKFLSLEA